jgi:hypothetical protein
MGEQRLVDLAPRDVLPATMPVETCKLMAARAVTDAAMIAVSPFPSAQLNEGKEAEKSPTRTLHVGVSPEGPHCRGCRPSKWTAAR